MINYGLANQQWYSFGGAAPTEADMEIMLGFYDNYMNGVPSLAVQQLQSRQAFTNSLEVLYQTQVTPGFSLYGQSLLNNYVPSHPDFDGGSTKLNGHAGSNYYFNRGQ